MEKKEDFSPEIYKVLHELEVLGYDRRKTAEQAQYKTYKTFSQTLSRGGNKVMLDKLLYVKQNIEQRINNPAFEALDIVKETKVEVGIIYDAIAELLAKSTGQSVMKVRSQFDEIKKERLAKKTLTDDSGQK